MNPVLLAIARRVGFETLETRNSDHLDFREVAVWELRAALEAAYAAGRADAAGGIGQAEEPAARRGETDSPPG